jgi:hypothetical protein
VESRARQVSLPITLRLGSVHKLTQLLEFFVGECDIASRPILFQALCLRGPWNRNETLSHDPWSGSASCSHEDRHPQAIAICVDVTPFLSASLLNSSTIFRFFSKLSP